jgi:hypothetical protein
MDCFDCPFLLDCLIEEVEPLDELLDLVLILKDDPHATRLLKLLSRIAILCDFETPAVMSWALSIWASLI